MNPRFLISAISIIIALVFSFGIALSVFLFAFPFSTPPPFENFDSLSDPSRFIDPADTRDLEAGRYTDELGYSPQVETINNVPSFKKNINLLSANSLLTITADYYESTLSFNFDSDSFIEESDFNFSQFVEAATIAVWIDGNGGGAIPNTLNDLNVHDDPLKGDANTTNAFDYVNEITSNGLIEDYNVTKEGGQFDVNWTSGAYVIGGYICNSVAGSSTLSSESNYWLYGTVASCPNLILSLTEPPVMGLPLIGHFHTTDNNIVVFEDFEIKFRTSGLYAELEDMHNLLVVSGLVAEDDGRVPLATDFRVTTGTFYRHHYLEEFLSSTYYSSGAGQDENNLSTHYHVGGSWDEDVNFGIPFGYWDDGTDIVTTANNKYYAGFIYIMDANKIGYVYPQTQHDNERDALNETPTYPPNFDEAVIFISKIIFRGSVTDLTQPSRPPFFVDIRPIHGRAETQLGWAFQNGFLQIVANTGSTTADDPDDVLTIQGRRDVNTSIEGDVLTIDVNLLDANVVMTGTGATFQGLNNGIIIDRDGVVNGSFPAQGQGIARAWDVSLNPDMSEMTYTLNVGNVEGGDVMCAEQHQGAITIRKCAQPYAINSVGVISFEAGYTTNISCSEMYRNGDGSPIFDENGFIIWETRGCANYKPLAVAGRVLTKVKCDTPISAGDLIVSSSRAGVGQSYKTISEPSIGEVWDYLGSAFGKALEDCVDNSPNNIYYIWVQIGGTAN